MTEKDYDVSSLDKVARRLHYAAFLLIFINVAEPDFKSIGGIFFEAEIANGGGGALIATLLLIIALVSFISFFGNMDGLKTKDFRLRDYLRLRVARRLDKYWEEHNTTTENMLAARNYAEADPNGNEYIEYSFVCSFWKLEAGFDLGKYVRYSGGPDLEEDLVEAYPSESFRLSKLQFLRDVLQTVLDIVIMHRVWHKLAIGLLVASFALATLSSNVVNALPGVKRASVDAVSIATGCTEDQRGMSGLDEGNSSSSEGY